MLKYKQSFFIYASLKIYPNNPISKLFLILKNGTGCKTAKFENAAEFTFSFLAVFSRGSRGPQVPWRGQGAASLVGGPGGQGPLGGGVYRYIF